MIIAQNGNFRLVQEEQMLIVIADDKSGFSHEVDSFKKDEVKLQSLVDRVYTAGIANSDNVFEAWNSAY